jgi:undecaprenyl-diphosphatase
MMAQDSKRIPFAAMAAAALIVFIWLARPALLGQPAAFDAPIRDAIHAHSSDSLTAAMKLATQLGSAYFVIPLGLFAVWRLTAAGRRRAATLLIIAAAGAEIVGLLLKLVFHRPRPDPFFGLAAPLAYSFPSTHAMGSACFYGALAAILAARSQSLPVKAELWVAAAALSLLIGFSRMYLGVHYPSDVLAGYSAAVVWAFCLHAGYSRWKRRRIAP